IAILAAILFPVFAQAREKARTVSCLSNTKQLNLAALMYAQDYDEMWSPAIMAWQNPYPCCPPANGQYIGDPWWMLLYPYTKNAGLYLCPSNANVGNWAWPQGGGGLMYGRPDYPIANVAYGLNWLVVGLYWYGWTGLGSWQSLNPQSMARTTNPAETILGA